MTFYCTTTQLSLETLLNGTLDELDGVTVPTVCDALRPMLQNIRVTMGGKIPTISLARPQSRFAEWGLQLTMDQYHEVRRQFEKIASKAITPEALQASIKPYSRYRHAARRFVELASEYCDVITAVKRMRALESAWFMVRSEYVSLLKELNAEFEKLPTTKWMGSKVMTSGVICDNPKLLQTFDDNHIAVVADDVAHESRFFKTDVPETDDPTRDLAVQFASRDHDILLCDPQPAESRRDEFVTELMKKSGVQGLVLFMQRFCSPEEMEYSYLRKALDDAGVPHIRLSIDQQTRDFDQAQTAIQAFVDTLSL